MMVEPLSLWSGTEFRSTSCAARAFEQTSKSAKANTPQLAFPSLRDCRFRLRNPVRILPPEKPLVEIPRLREFPTRVRRHSIPGPEESPNTRS